MACPLFPAMSQEGEIHASPANEKGRPRWGGPEGDPMRGADQRPMQFA